MIDSNFGCVLLEDPRDAAYPMSSVIPTTPNITKKYHWADGWWGYQGRTSMCVAYSWLHWLEDGPVIQNTVEGYRPKPLMDPTALYDACRDRDDLPGTDYKGSTVRGGAKVLKELNLIKNYWWATNVQDVVDAILTLGPVVTGTFWYESMNQWDDKGRIPGIFGMQKGGHAYVLNGVDTEKGYFRIKNSWGPHWGSNGYGFIKIEDYEKLLKKRGSACIATELKADLAPDLTSLKEAKD